jgi:hypothetical protein
MMSDKMNFLHKFASAPVAAESPVICVNFSVRTESSQLLKSAAAFLTLKWSFASVNSQMIPQLHFL